MTVHRLLGFRTSVPDPDALAGFFDELGLTETAGLQTVGMYP